MTETSHQSLSNASRKRQNFYLVEDITLRDIGQIVSRQKMVIFGIIIVSVTIASLTALLLPPVYRSKSVILPPRASNIEHLNVPGLFEISVGNLYSKVIRNLKSNELRLKFFRQNHIGRDLEPERWEKLPEYDIFRKKFNDVMQLEQPSSKEKNNDFVTITLDGENSKNLNSWLNGFVSFVDKYTVQNVIDEISAKIHVQESGIQEKINGLRNTAKNRRFDQIAVLEEAATLASKLGINESVYRQKEGIENSVVVISSELPKYLQGANALLAEVQILRDRKSDDPFINDLRSLQEQLFFLKKVQSSLPVNVHAIRIDQPALTLDQPVKPNRKLIIAIGIVVGVFLGVIVGFVKNYIESNRKKSMCVC